MTKDQRRFSKHRDASSSRFWGEPLHHAAPRASSDDTSDHGDDEDEILPMDPDDPRWAALLPEEEPYDPTPEPGDFWIGADEAA